jgi:2-polyprenyl-3-methyl-5-hydroxy-6-metoxy-1,4-benzoquinol methylase
MCLKFVKPHVGARMTDLPVKAKHLARMAIAHYKKNLNSLKVRGFKNEEWFKKFVQCQEEITKLDPDPYYIEAYKKEEVYYWLNIPKWMYDDSKNIFFAKCLDIGCAYGTLALLAKTFFNCEIFATNIKNQLSPALLEKYHFNYANNNIELDQLPWDGHFDAIIFTEVLEHLNFHPLPTLRKIRSALSENGRLYLSTPEWARMTKFYSNLAEIPYPKSGSQITDEHHYIYTYDELLRLFDSAGFEVVRFAYSPGVVKKHFNFALEKV